MGRDAACVFVLGLLIVLVAGAVRPGARWTARGASTIVVPDDCSTIQEAVDSAVDGDTIFVKAGIYVEHVVVSKIVSLVGEDVSATIIDGNDTGHVVNVVSDNVSISGFTIRNSGNIDWPALEAGICLNNSAGCVVSGNRLVDNGFCGISLLNSHRNVIVDNNITRSNWGGIHLLASSYNTVSRNVVDSTYGGINGHASSHYNNITENVISNSTHGMFFHDANRNIICGNNISDIALEGIWLQDLVSYSLVADNSIINSSVGIRVQGPNNNNALSKNFITGAEFGVKIENARYTSVKDNVIVSNLAGSDPWSAGIWLQYGSGSIIHFNLIADNYYGVVLYSDSTGVSVSENNITYNEFGIRVASGGSNNVRIAGNIILSNRGYGIGLTGFGSGSNHAIVLGNVIVNNSDGIALGQYSNFNTISRNDINANRNGFYIEYSTQNLIFNNNIVNNTYQTHVSAGLVNSWDSGYPAGGNYWSDYDDVDVMHGAGQNLTGSDGIWDNPCMVGYEADRYPLAKPYLGRRHDLAVTSFTTSKTVVGQGYNVSFSVMMFNYGDFANGETFNVTFYMNDTMIATLHNVSLGSRQSLILKLDWNTDGFARGNYSTLVVADTVFGEIDDSDNRRTCGIVVVAKPCDLNFDEKVDLKDVFTMARAYGSFPGGPNWNQNYDINNDGKIDLKDYFIMSKHFGRTDP